MSSIKKTSGFNKNHCAITLTCISILSSAVSINSQAETSTGADLEQVTTTANRIETVNSGYSITSIPAQSYSNATHISQAITSSSSSWISQGSGQENLTAIRSPSFVGAGACGEFLMAEDGLSLRAPNFCNVNQLFDANYIQAQGIDIQKGPGSVVYGSNAIHGIINIISPNYLLSDLEDEGHSTKLAFADSSHGFNRYALDTRTNSTIVQAMFDDDQGYKKDSAYQQGKIRLKFLQELSTQWQLSHNINLMNLEQDTAGYISGADAYKDDSLKKANDNPGAYRDAYSLRYSAQFKAELDNDRTLIVTPYLRHNDMEFTQHWIFSDDGVDMIEKNGHSSLGVQSIYLRNYGRWEITTGFDLDYTEAYLEQDNEGQQIDSNIKPWLPYIPEGELYDYDVSARSTSVLIDSRYPLHETLWLQMGIRYDWLTMRYSNNLADGSTCLPGESNCRYYRPDDSKDRFYDWSPKLSLSYEFSPNHYSSINISRSFRSPQATEMYRLEGNQTNSSIDSEQADNIEWVFNGYLGFMSYNFSAYYMEKDNVIIKDSTRATVDGQETKHQGLEAETHVWAINDVLSFTAAYSYGKHTYESSYIPLFGSGDDIKGNIMDTAPRHLGSIRADYFAHWGMQIALEAVYLGKYYLNPENTKSYEGHTLSNLYLKQALPISSSASIDLGIAVKNLADIDYADRADVTPGSGAERYFIGEPRSFLATIDFNF